MLQSKTFRAMLSINLRHLFLRHCMALLSLGFICSSIAQSSLADDSLLDGDMGFASSATGNSLIDSSVRADEPAQPKLSPAQAAALVRSKVGGQVMSVNSQRSDSGIIYGVKVLNDGRMRVINVDGQTGQLLNY